MIVCDSDNLLWVKCLKMWFLRLIKGLRMVDDIHHMVKVRKEHCLLRAEKN